MNLPPSYQQMRECNRPRRIHSPASILPRPALLFGLLLLTWVGCAEVPVPDPNVRYVAFGDSATAGPSERDYADFLREIMAEPPEAFVNAGVGGETAGDGLQRLRSLIDLGIYPNAHTLLYWEGGAQIIDFIAETDPFLLLSPDAAGYPYAGQLTQELDQIQGQIEAAIEAGHGNGWTVYVATYFMIPQTFLACERLLLDTMIPGQARNANVYIALLNDRIRQAAGNRSGILVDIATIEELSRNAGNFVNCNHLSADGNRIVAERFFETISATATPP